MLSGIKLASLQYFEVCVNMDMILLASIAKVLVQNRLQITRKRLNVLHV